MFKNILVTILVRLFTIQLLITGGKCDSIQCTHDDLINCAQPLKSLQDNGLSLADNKTVLVNSICPMLRSAVLCVTKYTKICMNLESGKAFQRVFDDTNQMVQRLCFEKTFQKEYLMHTKCTKQVAEDNKKCFRKYEKVLQGVTSEQQRQQPTSEHDNSENLEKAKKLCCSLDEYINCSSASVANTCGPEASLFSRNFLSNMSRTLNQDYCRNLTRNCEKSNSLRTQANWFLIVSVTVISTVLLQLKNRN